MNYIEINNKQEIIQDYKNGLRIADLIKKYKLHYPQIYRIFNESGVEAINIRSKYRFDIKFFDIIDTEEKAYLLGLLYADGYNMETRNTVCLHLNIKDLNHIEKVKKILKADHPIKHLSNRTRQQFGISLTNKRFSEKLAELGCMQAKTFKIKFPTTDQVPNSLLRHFIRGYFDGDGCIQHHYTKRSKREIFQISFVGTENFCNKLRSIIQTKFSINGYINTRHPERNHNIRQLIYGGNLQVQTVLDWIYKNSLIQLDRKFKKYLYLLETNSIPREKRVSQIDPITGETIKIWINIKEAANAVDSWVESIRVICCKGFKYKSNGEKYTPIKHKGFIWKYTD